MLNADIISPVDSLDSRASKGIFAIMLAIKQGVNGKGVAKVAESLLWAWAFWYTYAWVGHFVFQRDIPAVFTYGM